MGTLSGTRSSRVPCWYETTDLGLVKTMLLALAGFLFAGASCAAEPLPQPLSLEQALTLAALGHPLLDAADAVEADAVARLQAVASEDDSYLVMEGSLAYIEPAELSNFQQRNDSRLSLRLEKRLYDFGYSEAREAAAREELEAARFSGLNTRQQHYLRVMQAFFDVLLADLEYARDNEALAIAFVRLDRFRNRHELGQLSDVELLEHRSQYEKALTLRTASEARQRLTRLRLATLLNRPDQLPSELLEPEPPAIDRPLPDRARLLQAVIRTNPRLKALQARLAAARQSLAATRKRYGPVVRGELSAHEYYRETRSTHPLRVELLVEVPLYAGGRDDAETARSRARLMASQAREANLKLKLSQEVQELWLEQQDLQRRARELKVRDEYRELYLDRSRALYELERTSDLGDAMVQTSAVRLETARIHYQWRLNEARLMALAGELLQPTGEMER